MFPEWPSDAELAKFHKEFVGQTRAEKMNHHDRALGLHTFGPSCGECLTKCPAPWK